MKNFESVKNVQSHKPIENFKLSVLPFVFEISSWTLTSSHAFTILINCLVNKITFPYFNHNDAGLKKN